jgi:hypothetical protein
MLFVGNFWLSGTSLISNGSPAGAVFAAHSSWGTHLGAWWRGGARYTLRALQSLSGVHLTCFIVFARTCLCCCTLPTSVCSVLPGAEHRRLAWRVKWLCVRSQAGTLPKHTSRFMIVGVEHTGVANSPRARENLGVGRSADPVDYPNRF